MSGVDLSVVYSFFEEIDGAIGEVRFVQKPKFQLLEAIADHEVGKPPVLLGFDETFLLGDVDDVANETWSHLITSACLQSNTLCDESYLWFEFSRMERLTIQARLHKRQDSWGDDELMTLQNAISQGMPELKELRLVLDCGNNAFSQAQAALNWPGATFNWSVERWRIVPGRRSGRVMRGAK